MRHATVCATRDGLCDDAAVCATTRGGAAGDGDSAAGTGFGSRPRRRLIGARREFISSGRLDNQASCYCGTTALVESLDSLEKDASLRVLAMFDHEEVGSLSQQGAQSPTLRDVLARAYAAAAPRGDFRAFLARSFQISSDMARRPSGVVFLGAPSRRRSKNDLERLGRPTNAEPAGRGGAPGI